MERGPDGEWFDQGRRVDVAGFAADDWHHYSATPLKRWWRENWFQPIARIGEVGNYEHVLRPAEPLPVVNFSKVPAGAGAVRVGRHHQHVHASADANEAGATAM